MVSTTDGFVERARWRAAVAEWAEVARVVALSEEAGGPGTIEVPAADGIRAVRPLSVAGARQYVEARRRALLDELGGLDRDAVDAETGDAFTSVLEDYRPAAEAEGRPCPLCGPGPDAVTLCDAPAPASSAGEALVRCWLRLGHGGPVHEGEGLRWGA